MMHVSEDTKPEKKKKNPRNEKYVYKVPQPAEYIIKRENRSLAKQSVKGLVIARIDATKRYTFRFVNPVTGELETRCLSSKHIRFLK